jgi:hypothetical protein
MILDIPRKIERRESPRFVVDLSVDIILESGNILTVSTRNISSNGVQIACDAWIANEIEPRGLQSYNISHLRFKIAADLKVDDMIQKFYANSRIMAVHRVSQEEYLLSIKFLDFENSTQNVLNKFLEQNMPVNVIHKGVIGE